MFDLSFGEMLVVALVVLIVVGPRELPRLLKTVGQGLSRLRNMSRDLRAQSGIDDLIREEGLDEDLRTLRSLSKGRVVDAIVNDAVAPKRAGPPPDAPKTESLPSPKEGPTTEAAGAPATASDPEAPAPAALFSSDASATDKSEGHVERERLGVPVPSRPRDGGRSSEGGADP